MWKVLLAADAFKASRKSELITKLRREFIAGWNEVISRLTRLRSSTIWAINELETPRREVCEEIFSPFIQSRESQNFNFAVLHNLISLDGLSEA